MMKDAPPKPLQPSYYQLFPSYLSRHAGLPESACQVRKVGAPGQEGWETDLRDVEILPRTTAEEDALVQTAGSYFPNCLK